MPTKQPHTNIHSSDIGDLHRILKKLNSIQESLSLVDAHYLDGYKARHKLREDRRIIRESIERIQTILKSTDHIHSNKDAQYIDFIEHFVLYFEGLLHI